MANKSVKVAITGAAGHIGYALLFRIASGQMFGHETAVELQLLELPDALPALDGVAMELDDCAFPLLKNVVCTSDLATAMKGANVALLIGAVPRKAGMERSDLLQVNGKIFTVQGRAINAHAADDVKVLVVGNPCNNNCLIAMNNAPDVPDEQFFAMTMLDELRARAQLAKKAQVTIDDIKMMAIWGNHSATQYPDFYQATIQGKPVVDRINEDWLQNDFISTVQQRGAAIIKARGSSSAASAANAIIQSIAHLYQDTPKDDVFSICKASVGEYEIEPGLIFSYPCRVSNGQLSVVTGIEHNAFARAKLAATLKELQEEKEAIKTLRLI